MLDRYLTEILKVFSQYISVYTNDVAFAAGDSLIHLYADDTILYTSGPSTALKHKSN